MSGVEEIGTIDWRYGARPRGICLGCNYDLRGLTEYRCPECGRAFDPNDPRTMNFGRVIGDIGRQVLSPRSGSYFITPAVGVAMTWWGLTWLLGVTVCRWLGPVVLLTWLVYSVLVTVVQIAVAQYYRKPRPLETSRCRKVMPWALLFLLALIPYDGNLPLILAVQINRVFVESRLASEYASVPTGSQGPGWQGIFYTTQTDLQAGGIRIHVFGGGTLLYHPKPFAPKETFFSPLGGSWYTDR